jgi:hypothetical protein
MGELFPTNSQENDERLEDGEDFTLNDLTGMQH